MSALIGVLLFFATPRRRMMPSESVELKDKGEKLTRSKEPDVTSQDERIAKLEEQLGVVLAKEEIREVLFRYARGVDRKDLKLLQSCYHPDSIDAHWSFIGNGKEFAEDILKPHQMGDVRNYKHFITNVLIELDGDRAFCESSYLFTQTVPISDDRVASMASEGRYLDIFERRADEWRIFRRLLVAETLNWSLPTSVAIGELGTHPIPTPEQRAADFPHDPVYRGFGISEIIPTDYRTNTSTWEASIAFLRSLVM